MSSQHPHEMMSRWNVNDWQTSVVNDVLEHDGGNCAMSDRGQELYQHHHRELFHISTQLSISSEIEMS